MIMHARSVSCRGENSWTALISDTKLVYAVAHTCARNRKTFPTFPSRSWRPSCTSMSEFALMCRAPCWLITVTRRRSYALIR